MDEGGTRMLAATSRFPTARRRALPIAAVALLCLATAASAAVAAATPSFGDWSAPVSLGPTVNSASGDATPAVSRDGLTLVFDSDRPGGAGARDVWIAKRPTVGAPWGAPTNPGPPVNTASADYGASFSPDGHWLFFNSDRAGGFGRADVYASYRADVHDDSGWQTPVNLGANVNGPSDDGGPRYFENGGRPQLIFNSVRDGRRPDLFVSNLQDDGTWGVATRIAELNSVELETSPGIREDGLEILFNSDRTVVGVSDLWFATRASVEASWSTPVRFGEPLNSSANDRHPYLGADGRTLFFSSGRPGGLGGDDLYVTTRDAVLTVTASDRSRLFGRPNPPLGYELAGFVAGETSSVVSGAAECSTTATPSSPAGAYPIACTAGSLGAAGYVFGPSVAGTLTVTYSRPCLDGVHAGGLHVGAGEAVCVGAGGLVAGPVTVAPGGSLDVEGGRIIGPLTAAGAGAVRICGASITGPLTLADTTGPVLVGDTGSCQSNTIVGPVRVTGNAGGVGFDGNRVVGPLRIAGNADPVHAAGNTVTGPVVIEP